MHKISAYFLAFPLFLLGAFFFLGNATSFTYTSSQCQSNGYDAQYHSYCYKQLNSTTYAFSSSSSYAINKCMNQSWSSTKSCPETYTKPSNGKCIASDTIGNYNVSGSLCRRDKLAVLRNDSYTIKLSDNSEILSVMSNDSQNDSHSDYWKIENSRINNSNSCFDVEKYGTNRIRIKNFNSGTKCEVGKNYTFTYSLDSHFWVAWCNGSSINSNNGNPVLQGNVCGKSGNTYNYKEY